MASEPAGPSDPTAAAVRELRGMAAHTHQELERAAVDVRRHTLGLQHANERFRKALADHLSAVTGAQVDP